MCVSASACVFRSLQDVQIWFQPTGGSSSAAFLPHSDSQDGFGKSVLEFQNKANIKDESQSMEMV